MSQSLYPTEPTPATVTNGPPGTPPACNRVMIAVDDSDTSRRAIPHGLAVARALGAAVVLLQVVEPNREIGGPVDPLEWNLVRQRVRSHVEALAAQQGKWDQKIEAEVQEGRPSDQICQWARAHHVGLTVLCSQGGGAANGTELGRTARRVIECAPSSILLVPATAKERASTRLRRILVPLDGSSRAESALPVALRLAEAEDAKIVLVHAVPEAELTEIGPLEPGDLELRTQLLQRNERIAKAYLGRVRTRISGKQIPVTVNLLKRGDVRHLLMRAMADEQPDLVVMASHGHSGHTDVPVGSVASHVLAQASIPVLLVRNHATISRTGGNAISRPFVIDPRHIARVAA